MAWAQSNRINISRALALSGLLVLAVAALIASVAGVMPPAAPAISNARVLEHLPMQAQGVISTALGAHETGFDARATRSGYRLTGGGVVANLGRRGAELSASGGSVWLSLQAFGTGANQDLLGPGALVAHGNRVVIGHGDVTEWYAAGPLGVEQGFTVARRPAGAAGELTLSLATRGSLVARSSSVGLTFVSRSGRVVLRYGGLDAIDASGRALPATVVAERGRLVLRILDRGARYPVRVDPFVQEGSKLTGSGEIGQGGFGWSATLSGDGSTALIGAEGDNSAEGAAWVFTQTGGIWTEQAELVGDCTSACSGPNGTGEIGGGQFGRSVALSTDGNTALIGAHSDNSQAGAAWVFTRSGGVWSQQAKLVGDCVSSCAGNGTGEVGGGIFGWSVSLSGDGNTALIGAPFDNSNVGAAWLFTRSGGVWSQLGSKLVGGSEVGTSAFGYSVALSSDGSTALVGGDFDNSDTGAAWVFGGPGTTITGASTKLIASCTSVCGGTNGTGEVGAGQFGASVALSSNGSTALIGGFYDNNKAGAAWVFTNTGSGWNQQGQKLTPSDEIAGNFGGGFFGWSVALSADGNTGLIGGQYDNSSAGAAWVFSRSAGVWSEETKLVGDCTAASCTGPNGTGEIGNGWFGNSVSLSADGSTALIGSPGDNDGTGAGWVFGPPSSSSPPGGSPPPGGGTPPGGGQPQTALSCTLKSPSARIAVRKATRRHKAGPGTLSLVAECNQNVEGILTGSAQEALGKHRTKTVKLGTVGAALRAGVRQTLKLEVPASLVLALEHHVKASATLTLTVGGRKQATTRITLLKA